MIHETRCAQELRALSKGDKSGRLGEIGRPPLEGHMAPSKFGGDIAVQTTPKGVCVQIINYAHTNIDCVSDGRNKFEYAIMNIYYIHI